MQHVVCYTAPSRTSSLEDVWKRTGALKKKTWQTDHLSLTAFFTKKEKLSSIDKSLQCQSLPFFQWIILSSSDAFAAATLTSWEGAIVVFRRTGAPLGGHRTWATPVAVSRSSVLNHKHIGWSLTSASQSIVQFLHNTLLCYFIIEIRVKWLFRF